MKPLAILCVASLLLSSSSARGDILWYNGDPDPDGGAFPNGPTNSFRQIVYTDFLAGNWRIGSIWENVIFQGSTSDFTTAHWEIRSNMPTGTLVAGGDAPATRMPTPFVSNSGTPPVPVYTVGVVGLDVTLSPGTYWLTVYPVLPDGAESSVVLTNGAHAVGVPPGNNGNTYSSHGQTPPFFAGPNPRDASVGIGSFGSGIPAAVVPEPSCLLLAGTSAIGLAACTRLRRAARAPQ
jgi:hypothetical protein